MILQLQKYDLCVRYQKGKNMYLADTLSRAHLSDISMCEEEQEVARVEHTSTIAMSAEQLQRLRQASAEDPVLSSLRQIILKGWPPAKANLPNHLMPYIKGRDQSHGNSLCQLWSPRYLGHRQWSSVRSQRVRGIYETLGCRTHHLLPSLSTVKQQSRERGEKQ